jgi:putative ATPase
MEEPGWYQPVERGLEARIKDKLEQLRELDRAAGERALDSSED